MHSVSGLILRWLMGAGRHCNARILVKRLGLLACDRGRPNVLLEFQDVYVGPLFRDFLPIKQIWLHFLLLNMLSSKSNVRPF